MITANHTILEMLFPVTEELWNVQKDRDWYRGMYVKLRELLQDVLCSGVAEQYPTIDYLDVQINKVTWEEIKEALK